MPNSINYSSEEFTRELLPSKPLASSTLHCWKNMYFQHHIEGAMEIPEHAPMQDAFIVIHQPSGRPVKRIIDDKLHEKIDNAEDVIIVPAGTSHSVAWSGKAAFSILAFEPGHLASFGYDMFNPDKFRLSPRFRHRDPAIYGIVQTLKACLDLDKPLSQMYLDSVSSFISSHLAENYSPTPVGFNASFSPKDFSAVINYIQNNLSEKIALSDLSNLMNMSQSYFSRAFKETTGTSPYQYLMRCRVQKSKLLLKANFDLARVAQETGFSSSSHFISTFRRFSSVTPEQFRKML
jgi:AraC family transcriptional regulator